MKNPPSTEKSTRPADTAAGHPDQPMGCLDQEAKSIHLTDDRAGVRLEREGRR